MECWNVATLLHLLTLFNSEANIAIFLIVTMLPVYSIVSEIKFIVKFNHNVEIMQLQGKQCVITGLQQKKEKVIVLKPTKKKNQRKHIYQTPLAFFYWYKCFCKS